MKKLLVVLGLVSLMAPAAMAADKYASVDLGKVLNGYSKGPAISAKYQKEEADIRVFVLDAQKAVLAAKSDADKKALEDKYNKELQAKVAALQAKKDKDLKEIEAAVKAQIDRVGKAGGYALVLPSTSALYGTVDISDEIIKGLNK